MEDWQEWQLRADQIANMLREEVAALEQQYQAGVQEASFRGFWPRFRELKERVRTAPAIKLEDKLELERKLRDLGNKAYKAQEGMYAKSAERKTELLGTIAEYRASAERLDSPRELRTLRRNLDDVRSEFDSGPTLVPADRQAVWEAWREASQYVWQRLTGMWSENEVVLRGILDQARQAAEAGQVNQVRQQINRFFEALRTHEARQNAINALKGEAESIRREAEQSEERKQTARMASISSVPSVSPVEGWRSELERNREVLGRLVADIASIEAQMQSSDSILEQAMLRGTLVEKKQRLSELERSSRALEQRIGQTEDSPLIPTA